MTPPIDEMRDAIARYESWQFQADMADDDQQAADSAQDAADRARADIKTFALASIAESLARIADIMSVRQEHEEALK